MSIDGLRIALLAGGESFTGDTPKKRALGGSETACVQMAAALADRGHQVEVYCHCPKPGVYSGVTYYDISKIVDEAPKRRLDVLVVSRAFPLLDLPLQSGLRVLWNHDVLDQPAALRQRMQHLDINLVLSRYHAEIFSQALPECASGLVVTRNGLDMGLIKRTGVDGRRVSGKFTYVSRPERGLRLLLEYIWPAVRRARPRAELHLCGYQVNSEGLDPKLRAEYRNIERLIEGNRGVINQGALSKPDYYRHLASCEALLYPCEFPEISCIAALEAQALGTPIITSDGFALSETVVEEAFKVPGRPGSAEYVDEFIRRTLELTGPEGAAPDLAGRAQKEIIHRHDWAIIAKEWEELFLERLGMAVTGHSDALAASLVINGSRLAASSLLGRALPEVGEGPPPPDPGEAALIGVMAGDIKRMLESLQTNCRIGVISSDQGRTAQALSERIGHADVVEIQYQYPEDQGFGVVVIRDRLEREPHPDQLLGRAAGLCADGGWLLLCTASGAWPLIMGGHLGRQHDLGERELDLLLEGRPHRRRFMPSGLVGRGAQRYFAGRWIVAVPAAGGEFGRLDPTVPLRTNRPAPPYLVAELSRAGLI